MASNDMRVPFECPICGADEFCQVYIANREGQPARWTQAYQCIKCTVMFRDAGKFTTHRTRRRDGGG